MRALTREYILYALRPAPRGAASAALSGRIARKCLFLQAFSRIINRTNFQPCRTPDDDELAQCQDAFLQYDFGSTIKALPKSTETNKL